MLRERMARGGMGEVFRAVAVGAGGFEKPVVVKRILPQLGDSELLAEMFIEEARLMSRLVHPNIVQVIDFGQGQRDDYFLVMELVDGVDLGAFSKHYAAQQGGMPVELALYIISQVLRGLQHAHKKAYGDGRTLVHRDISPGNVLLSKVGEVKVADFGVAHVAHPNEANTGEATRSKEPIDPGALVGKPSYMAPEQFAGDNIDVRADVWAVGVVLFQMLTRQMPFAGDSGAERQAEAKALKYRRASDLRPNLGEPLVAVLDQALAFDPANRFGSARAMARAIDSLREDGYAIATDDDLAAAVELIAELAEEDAKRVIVLASDTTAPSSVGELTRTGPRGEFTMRVSQVELTERSMIRTTDERVTNVEPQHQPAEEIVAALSGSSVPATRSTPVWLALGFAVALAGGVGAWWFGRGPIRETLGPRSSTLSSTAAVVSTKRKAPLLAPSVPSAESTTTSSPSSARPLWTQPPAPTLAVPSPMTTSAAHATASASTQPPLARCRGKVLLSAKGSWWVSGGPQRVQAPGQYSWPCGNYTLQGQSRVDARRVTQSINVRDGKLSSARFQ